MRRSTVTTDSAASGSATRTPRFSAGRQASTRFRHLVACCLTALVALGAAGTAAAFDEPRDYPRNDPDNPGGERVGDHEDATGGDDDFTGYPADPGDPDDEYYDQSTEYRAYSPSYTGATFGIGIRGGFAQQYGPQFDDKALGPAFGGFLNMSTVLQVVTLEGGLSHSRFDNSIGGEDVSVTSTSLDISQALHPGLFLNIGASRLLYTLATFKLMFGGTFAFNHVEGENIDAKWARAGFMAGLGMDTYLDSIHDGRAMWVGFEYRWVNMSGGQDEPEFRHTWMRQHQFFIRFTYRINGNIIRGLRGPDIP